MYKIVPSNNKKSMSIYHETFNHNVKQLTEQKIIRSLNRPGGEIDSSGKMEVVSNFYVDKTSGKIRAHGHKLTLPLKEQEIEIDVCCLSMSFL